ncbi:MAG: hypothetical protein U0Y82_02175 [Thermoleophilia bacterium]
MVAVTLAAAIGGGIHTGGASVAGGDSRAFGTGAPIGSATVTGRTFRWPIKPFDRPHPIRATFGEPRGLVDTGLPPQSRDLTWLITHSPDKLSPLGTRVVHTGLDITARDGTPVYAVQSGWAVRSGTGYETQVKVGSFAYAHVSDAVPTGTYVTAYRTVVGRVYPGQHHVHLTEFSSPRGVPVNPLVGGGPTGYRDTTPPVIRRVIGYDANGVRVPLTWASGPIVLAVNAADLQTQWHLETGVYRLSYSFEGLHSHRIGVPFTTMLQLDTLPVGAAANTIYTLGSTRHTTETRFWYRITNRSPSGDGLLHLERYLPGWYLLRVTASDARGNTTTRGFRILVTRPGQVRRHPH